MRLLLLLSMGLLLGACQSPRPELSASEQAAVDRLARDAWVDVLNVQRDSEASLLVLTRQGDKRISYRVTIDQTGEATYQRLPKVTFGR